MMQPTAIILAAGRGSRLGPLTEDIPKCLLRLGGRTLLDWQIASLSRAGIEQIVLVGGYRSDALRKHILNDLLLPETTGYRRSPPIYRTNPDWEHSSIVRSLLYASDMLRESECIVCYSDILYHPDHIDALIHAPGDLSITYDELWRNLWEARFEHPLLDAETFSCKRGKLLGIGHRAEKLEDIQGQYMGLTLIRPDGWQKLEKSISQMRFDEINSLDMTSLFNRVISHDLEINTVPVKGRWCEVDSAADLNLYNNKLKSEEHWSHDWRWEYTI